MKHRTLTLLGTGLAWVFSLSSASLQAATIGLNFSDSATSSQISDGSADGFANWTDSWLTPEGNFDNTGTNASLKGGGPVRVTWQSTNGWNAGSAGDNEQALYNRYLDDGNTGSGIGVRVTVTKMARWLALNEHTSYQVRCYGNNDSSNTFRAIAIRNGGATGTLIENMTVAALGDGDFPTGGTPGSGASRGYADSSSTLTADTLGITVLSRSGATRGTLSAFKITGIGTGPPVDHFESGDGTVSVVNAALGANLTSVFRAGLDAPTVTGTFSVSSPHRIQVIQPTSGFAIQPYDLLTWPAAATVNLGDFVLDDLPRGVTGVLEIASSDANPVLQLNVTDVSVPQPLYWNGNLAGGAWDVKTTANWRYEGALSTYREGDQVVFDNTAVGTTAVALDAAVLPATVTVENDAVHPYSITGQGAINGSASVIKLGPGTLTLGTANGYSGPTSIEEGVVILESDTALGAATAGTSVFTGARLDLNGANINGEALTLAGDGPDGGGALVNSSATSATATGALTLTADATIGGAGDIVMSAVAGGAYRLAKAGAGTVFTSSPFTLTGTFEVNEGTWSISAGSSFNSLQGVTINGGTVVCVGDNKPFGAGPSAANAITIREGGALHTVDGSCHLGTMNLDGGAITATNARTDWANYNLDQPVVTPGSGKTSTIAGGNLTLSQVGGTLFNIGAGDTLVISAKIDGDTLAADNGLRKDGAGTLVLSGIHTYDSATTVTNGTLRIDGSANRSPSVTVAATATLAGSGSMTAAAATIDGVVSPGGPDTPQGTLTLGATNLNGTLAVTLDGGACSRLAAAGDLTLDAAATVTFTSAPTAPVYELATCTGTLSGTFATAPPDGYQFVYDTTAGKVQLVSDTAGFATWIAGFGLPIGDQGLDDDPDGDGVANGIEYILGGNPAADMDAGLLPKPSITGGNLVLEFDRVVSSETPDVALFLQHGDDLAEWTDLSLDAASPPMVTIVRSGDGLTDRIKVSLPFDPAADPNYFARLKVTSALPAL